MFTLQSPLKVFKVNQTFGINGDYYRDNGINIDGHNGLDLYALDGTEVYAAHDGVVVFTGHDNKAGLGVVIRTLEKFPFEGKEMYFKTIYWHLKEGSVTVKPDKIVKVGDLIGLADNTGLSTGSHLHFGLKPVYKGEKSWEWLTYKPNNGYGGAIDPLPYFENIPHTFHKDMLFDGGKIYDREVEMFQSFLVGEGFLSPVPQEQRGLYGNKTREAVFKFQEKHVGLSWYERVFLRGSRIGQKTRNVANQIIFNKAK